MLAAHGLCLQGLNKSTTCVSNEYNLRLGLCTLQVISMSPETDLASWVASLPTAIGNTLVRMSKNPGEEEKIRGEGLT